MKIGKIHRVEIDDADGADARRGEIKEGRRSESAGADDKNFRALQRQLPFFPDLRQKKMPAVADQLVRTELAGAGCESIVLQWYIDLLG